MFLVLVLELVVYVGLVEVFWFYIFGLLSPLFRFGFGAPYFSLLNTMLKYAAMFQFILKVHDNYATDVAVPHISVIMETPFSL